MKRILILAIIILFFLQLSAQEKYVVIGGGTTLFGEMDLKGFSYKTEFQYSFPRWIDVKTGIHTAYAQKYSKQINDSESEYLMYNIANNYTLLIKPVQANFLYFYLGFGTVWRYRNQKTIQELQYTNNELSNISYNYVSKFDYGYTAEIDLRFKLSERLYSSINIGMFFYNNGSQLFNKQLCLYVKL